MTEDTGASGSTETVRKQYPSGVVLTATYERTSGGSIGAPPRMGPDDAAYLGHLEIELWNPSDQYDDGLRMSVQLPNPATGSTDEVARQTHEFALAAIDRLRPRLLRMLGRE